jgi:hypothetical protein
MAWIGIASVFLPLSSFSGITLSVHLNLKTPIFWVSKYAVEPGYNDIGLYDTSPIASDIMWQE